MSWPDPVTLQGEFASLLPLRLAHGDALATASSDGEVWRAWYSNGTLRDTCVYSILGSEWPAVRAHLDAMPGKHA